MKMKTLLAIALVSQLYFMTLINCGGGSGAAESNPTPMPITFGTSAKFVPPQWTGPYRVGSRHLHWVDQDRGEPHTPNDDDRRELMVRLFYPTDAAYTANRLALINPLRWSLFENEPPKPHLRLRRANYQDVVWDVEIDAPLSQALGILPVILFSHGYGLAPTDHVNLTAELASRGYLVASITHTYGANFAEFPDGRVIGAMALPSNNLGADLMLWSDDQLFVLNQLIAQLHSNVDSDFHHRINTSQIGVMGHSYGGAAAYYSAWQDPRVRAALNLDGTIFNSVGKDVEQPFMYIQNDNGYDWDIFDQVAAKGYAVAFENRIRHISFADYVLFWQWDFPNENAFGPLDSQTAFEIIQGFTDQFFKQTFSGSPQPWLNHADQVPEDVNFVIFE